MANIAAAKKLFNQLAQEGKESIMDTLNERRQKDIEQGIKDDLAGYTPEQRSEFLGLVKGKGGKGKKRERKVKDPNAPKGVKKAYFFFTGPKLAELKAENSDLTHKEAQKMCGEIWKEFSEEEKKPFMDQEAEDKARHDREMKAYDPSSFDPATVAPKKKKEKAPKKETAKKAKKAKKAKEEEPVEEEIDWDGFTSFKAQMLPALKKKHSDISDADAKERCIVIWKDLPSETKRRFQESLEEEEEPSNESSSEE